MLNILINHLLESNHTYVEFEKVYNKQLKYNLITTQEHNQQLDLLKSRVLTKISILN